MRYFLKSLGWLLLIAPVLVRGQVIADRATLNSIVGGSATTVDFQSFSGMSSASAVVIAGISALDSTTVANSQGPNLVPAGVLFKFPNVGDPQWNDAGYFGAPSREILSNHSPLEINFAVAATAFGLDLRAFQGYPSTATVTVYAADKSTVLATIPNLSLATSGVPIFFGYRATGGIGKVLLENSGQSWSPLIDNLTFTVIPEPSGCALLGCGIVLLVCVRRRVRLG